MIKLKSLLYETTDGLDIELKFSKLGTAQRGLPETIGTHAPILLQGSLTYPLEHVGDLIHRLSYNEVSSPYHGTLQTGGIDYGKEAALNKITNCLRYAADYKPSIEQFVMTVAQNNYNYINSKKGQKIYHVKLDTWNKEWNKIVSYLNSYAKAHQELVPISLYQQMANQAAIALGKMDTNRYIENLTNLKLKLERKDWRKHWYD